MSDGVLKDIRVAEFAFNVAGPYCGMMLADLGAEVIKIERPLGGDSSRAWGTWSNKNRSVMFLAANRNKKSIALNIQHSEGLAVAKKLIETSDILIESMSPGVANRLGIGFTEASKLRPDIIYVSISGYGQDGPWASEGGFDSMVQALTGLMDMTGPEGAPPSRIPVSSLDYMTGSTAFGAVMAALRRRDQSRQEGKSAGPQHIDASLYDCAINFAGPYLTEAVVTGRVQRRSGGELHYVYPYGVFQTRDGYISIGIGSDNLWRRFCPAFGLDSLVDDPRFKNNEHRVLNRKELKDILTPIFLGMSLEECLRMTRSSGLPATPVRSVADNLHDDHLKLRKCFDYIDISSDGKKVPFAASPIRIQPPAGRTAAMIEPPVLGHDTLDVLNDLGFSTHEAEALLRSSTISIPKSDIDKN